MSKLVVLEYVSLDGVIQAPGQAAEDPEGNFPHGGWSAPFIPAHRHHVAPSFHAADAFLFGRRTYEIFAAFWPTVTDPTDEIAAALNTRPKLVASGTLSAPAWPGTSVLTGDVAAEVAKLRDRPGRELLVVGSSRLAQSLADHALVDEYRLLVHPIVLGTGKKLFRDGSPLTHMELVEATTSTDGLVLLTYQPAKAPAGAQS
jgi:dihydrofolate reductase